MGKATKDPEASAVVASTRDPAFATDVQGRILAWNGAATRLLGFEASEVLGALCHERLAGRDVFGNRYCHPGCPLLGMARRHEAVGHFQVRLRCASGEMVLTGVNVIVVPGDGPVDHRTMIHILSPVVEHEDQGRIAGDARERPDRLRRLTPREAEVLELLADGKSTAEIAELLFLSVATVRNHIQNILRKLDVHSRLGAVAELRSGRSI